MQVNFVGEGSVDYGRPRREFFCFLAFNAKEKWFVGSSDRNFFADNVMGVQIGNHINMHVLFKMQAQNFYNLGRFCFVSICQGGNGFPFFAEQVYHYFVTGKCTAKMSKGAVDILQYS